MKNQLALHQVYHGFRLTAVREIPELSSLALTLTHTATGCEVFHLYNEDRENVFSFNFRTPPFDNSGVAHILEHSVLCGSKRFPLKDPFVALLRSSMKTFLNAITFPDKTIYPAASVTPADFYNLLAVYGDAVFFPLLKKQVFEQEGYHIEYSEQGNDKSDLRVVGVVYNEMRGNYSNQESIVSEWSQRSLFPDTPYGFDSGGEPLNILRLDYTDFVDFHRMYYHPSNCRIYFYGNIPTEKHLEFLENRFLTHFKKITVNSAIPLQKPFTEALRMQRYYPCQKGEPLEAKTTVTLNWALPRATDGFTILLWEFIAEMLVGNSGAPLWKALVESGLGQDIYPYSGLESELLQMVFSVGLRGTDKNRAREVEDLVFKTLEELCAGKIDRELTDAALNRVAFAKREIKGGRYPYGLRLLRRILRGWLHGVSPEETLVVDPHFQRLEEMLEKNDGYFEHVIRKYLLDNPHRSTVVVIPDPELETRENAGLQEYIKGVERTLTSEKKQELIASVAELKAFQQKQESPEDVKKIPYLHLHDLPAQVEHIPFRRESLDDKTTALFLHPMMTGDITYLDFAFSVEGMEDDLLRFVPMFGKVLCKTGLPDMKYDGVQRRLAALTGGFYDELFAGNPVQSDGLLREIIFRLKLLDDKLESGVSLVCNLLRQADFTDKARIKHIIREYYNDYKASLVPQGHHYAMLRAGSKLSGAMAVKEKWNGLEQFLFLHGLCTDLEANLEQIALQLEKIRRFLLCADRLKINVTAQEKRMMSIQKILAANLSGLPQAESGEGMQPERIAFTGEPQTESFLLSTSVNYVAHMMKGAVFGTREYATQDVLGHLLKTSFLWERVRMRGGAYGVFSTPMGFDELFCFASYRDPNVISTLEAFKQALAWVIETKPGRSELEKAVIGTVSHYEIPHKPNEKGFVSFKRALLGVSDELRQKNRDYILRTGKKELTAGAGALLEDFDRGSTAILSNEAKIKQEAKAHKALGLNAVRLPA